MEERKLCIDLVSEAVSKGARQSKACEILGISLRTLERWRKHPDKEDKRKGSHSHSANSLTDTEKKPLLI